MELQAAGAIACFQALAHPTRLEAFRRLVQRGTRGATPGTLLETLDVPAQTLSFHLKELASAGLVKGHREGRSIRYVAGFDAIRALAAYLMDNCCGAELAAPRQRRRGAR